jgi:hypothetical protein
MGALTISESRFEKAVLIAAPTYVGSASNTNGAAVGVGEEDDDEKGERRRDLILASVDSGLDCA